MILLNKSISVHSKLWADNLCLVDDSLFARLQFIGKFSCLSVF